MRPWANRGFERAVREEETLRATENVRAEEDVAVHGRAAAGRPRDQREPHEQGRHARERPRVPAPPQAGVPREDHDGGKTGIGGERSKGLADVLLHARTISPLHGISQFLQHRRPAQRRTSCTVRRAPPHCSGRIVG